MKKFINEFKEFVLRGNVLNLAVGIIIGGAFQGVVTSLTDNIISPILGLFMGKSFNSWKFSVLGVDILYGAFITSVINFIILAFVVFLIVKFVNKLMTVNKKPPVKEEVETRKCPFCMTEISIYAVRCPACT
ncbi:MAG: large conductance mechanosensitive channel protein MscL, partial [Oscillospiraceae bacterium]|nr:large conductance mechanosensitive channel protein MscL [Oscillospiraceae bacterium]